MKYKQTLFTLAIAIIFAFFVGYGIEVFHDAPDREDYCGKSLWQIDDANECEEAGGVWNKEADRPIGAGETEFKGLCSEPKSCYDGFNLANARHDKVVFVVGIIVGLLAVLGGLVLKKEFVSVGFVMGGILTILYGTLRYWRHANDVLKFVLLGIALAVIVWTAYKKLR